MKHHFPTQEDTMLLLMLEALGALLVLVFIVWWTMFSGRRHGEARSKNGAETSAEAPADERRD